MKAAIYNKYGGPEELDIQETDKPVPGEDELLVKVYASTVTRTDCGFLRGMPLVTRLFSGLLKPKQKILGEEFAGVVETVGNKVTEFQAGDRVFGYNSYEEPNSGSHAQYMTIASDGPVSHIPKELSFEEAAPSNEGLHYAYMYVRRFDLDSESRVLINGATGGIGSAAVQLCNHFGVEVVAVCDEERAELVRSLGADRIIDYTKEDFTRDEETFDVVFDAVGKSSFFECRRLLKPGGIFTASDLGPYQSNIFLALWTKLFGSFQGIEVLFPLPSHSREDLEFFKELIETDAFHPVIDRSYPLEDIAEAYSYVLKGEKTGNVVLVVEEEKG